MELPFDLVERVQAARRHLGAESVVRFEVRPSLGFSVLAPDAQRGLVVPVYANHVEAPPVELSRDQWLALIEELGFTRVTVVEMPVQLPATDAVRVAMQRLLEARAAFAHGNLEDVGPRAFRAFEALVPGRPDREKVFDAIHDRYLDQAGPKVAKAGKTALVALSNLYHIGGRHEAGPEPVGVHHARFLLHCAEAVVAWCGELSASAASRDQG